MGERKTERIFYLDILRVMECVAVIVIHLSGEMEVLGDIGDIYFWVGNIFNSLARFAVPIFVMISGALLLNEEYNYSFEKIKRHIKKNIKFYIFWSLFYALFRYKEAILNGDLSQAKNFVISIINGEYHLWFIPMIIGLYLLVPLLRLWVKKENKKQVELFLVLSIVFSFVIPTIRIVFPNLNIKLFDFFSLEHVSGYVSYFVLGWYLTCIKINIKKVLLYFAGAISLAVSIFGTYLLSMHYESFVHIYDNFAINVFLYSCVVFLIFQEAFNNGKYLDGNCKFVTFISDNSMGIYAVHIFSMNLVYKLHITVYPLVDLIANIILVFIISYTISFFMKKVPFFKQFA